MSATVRILSFRKRLCDIDNISAKHVIDGLVKAEILPDDTPTFVKEVIYRQFSSKEERTIIQVTWDESDETKTK
jgi:Holliday junction resolvase RusA-like endonuclease